MDKDYIKIGAIISSEKLCLREFLANTRSIVKPYVKGDVSKKNAKCKLKHREDVVLSLMGERYDSHTFKKLSQACSSDLLRVNGQPPAVNISVAKRVPQMCKTTKASGSNLKTIRNKIGERFPPDDLRYTSSIWLDHQPSYTPQTPNLHPGEKLMIVVKVYHPFKHNIGAQMRRVPIPSQEICLLESNTLAQFRDKILCSSDEVISRDVSDNPSEVDSQKAIEKYPSGMFFIDNRFYIDKRSLRNIDYSEVIKEWANSRKINVGETLRMEQTKFSDLSIRLGYPYVYQHQGDCEHLICFSDVRLLHESDPLELLSYPINRCFFRRYQPHCMCCSVSLARWVTVNNERLPHDPFFFCEECYISFNYIKGEKIGDFKAFPYVCNDLPTD